MRAWSISRQIAVGFGVILCFMAGLSGLATYTMQQVMQNDRALSQSFGPADDLGTSFEREVLNARIFFIYYVTIQKPGTLEKGWERYRAAEVVQQKFQALADARPELHDLRPGVARLRDDLDAYGPALKKTLDMVSSGVVRGEVYDAQVKDWAAKGATLVTDASKLETECAALSSRSSDRIMEDVHGTALRNALLCVASLVVCVVMAWRMVRQINGKLRAITHELREGAQQVDGAAGELSGNAKSLSDGATAQAESIEQAAMVTLSIRSSARKNSESSGTASQAVSAVALHVREGNERLAAMVASMEGIRNSSQAISKILKVIEDIAFQTNILSLNASVEAARAGTAGLGFSVVADEIRSLSQRCSQAAKDTESLIEQAMAKTQDGTVRLAEVNGSMHSINDEVAKFSGLIETVLVASREQNEGLEQIAGSMDKMERITQTAASNAQQSAASSAELNEQATGLRTLVDRLTMLVEGGEGQMHEGQLV